jgi:hypothetical protein
MRGGHDVACWSWHGRGLGAPLCSITISHWQTLANTGKHWQTNLLIAGLWSNNPTTGARATGTRSTEQKINALPPSLLTTSSPSGPPAISLTGLMRANCILGCVKKDRPCIFATEIGEK